MKKLMLLIYVLVFSVALQAQEIYKTKDGAIGGYDAVAYFKEAKPVKGDPEFSYLWKDAVWYFSTKENLKLFKKAPEKYAPQYGGYCAYGYSDGEGHAAPTKPEAFSIVNDKLYLNYNTDVMKSWTKNKEERIIKADKNYKAEKEKKKSDNKP